MLIMVASLFGLIEWFLEICTCALGGNGGDLSSWLLSGLYLEYRGSPS